MKELQVSTKKLSELASQLIPADQSTSTAGKYFKYTPSLPAATLHDEDSVVSDLTEEGIVLMKGIREIFSGKGLLSRLGNAFEGVGPVPISSAEEPVSPQAPSGKAGSQPQQQRRSSNAGNPVPALSTSEVEELDLTPDQMMTQAARMEHTEEESTILRAIAIFIVLRASLDHQRLLISRCEDRLKLCHELVQRQKLNPARFEYDADYRACVNLMDSLEAVIDDATTIFDVLEPTVVDIWTKSLARHVKIVDEYNSKVIKWNRVVLQQESSHRSNKIRTFRSLLTVMKMLAEGKLSSGKAELYFVRVQLFEDYSSVLEVVQRARDLREKYKNELCKLFSITGEPSADQINDWMVDIQMDDDKKGGKRRSSNDQSDASSSFGGSMHGSMHSRRSMTNSHGGDSSPRDSFRSGEGSSSMRRGSSRNNSMTGGGGGSSNGANSLKEEALSKKVMRFKVYKEAKQASRLEKYPVLIESVSLGLFAAAKRLFDQLITSKLGNRDPFAVSIVPAGRHASSSPEEADLWASYRAIASKRNTKILQHAVVVVLEHVLEGLMTVHLSSGTSKTADAPPLSKDAADPTAAVKELLGRLEEPDDEESCDNEKQASEGSAGDAEPTTLPFVQVGRCLSAKYRELQHRQQAMYHAGKDLTKRKPLTGRDLVVARVEREHPRLPFWHAPVPRERPPAMPRVPSPLGIRPGTATKERLETLRLALTPRLPSAKRKDGSVIPSPSPTFH